MPLPHTGQLWKGESSSIFTCESPEAILHLPGTNKEKLAHNFKCAINAFFHLLSSDKFISQNKTTMTLPTRLAHRERLTAALREAHGLLTGRREQLCRDTGVSGLMLRSPVGGGRACVSAAAGPRPGLTVEPAHSCPLVGPRHTPHYGCLKTHCLASSSANNLSDADLSPPCRLPQPPAPVGLPPGGLKHKLSCG